MTIGEAIRAVMKSRKVTVNRMGELLGVAPNSVTQNLNRDAKAIEIRIAMLEACGYELIVREKRQGRRAEGEYVITAGEKK